MKGRRGGRMEILRQYADARGECLEENMEDRERREKSFDLLSWGAERRRTRVVREREALQEKISDKSVRAKSEPLNLTPHNLKEHSLLPTSHRITLLFLFLSHISHTVYMRKKEGKNITYSGG